MSQSMSERTILAAAAVLLLAAPMLLAQGAPGSTKTNPTSAQRIPITKEAGASGEVGARRDTVTVYRTRVDTVASYRVDTVRMRGRSSSRRSGVWRRPSRAKPIAASLTKDPRGLRLRPTAASSSRGPARR